MLTDLLDEKQIKDVKEILTHPLTDEIEKTKRLKSYLSWFRKELEEKEVLPEYLAYLLIHLHNEGKL